MDSTDNMGSRSEVHDMNIEGNRDLSDRAEFLPADVSVTSFLSVSFLFDDRTLLNRTRRDDTSTFITRGTIWIPALFALWRAFG